MEKKIAEGIVDDPVNVGYGVEGEHIIDEMNMLNSTITKIKAMIHKEVAQGVRSMFEADALADKAITLQIAAEKAPWGLAWTANGKPRAKFFESSDDRDYWANLKNYPNARKINPKHWNAQITKLNKKD